MGRDASDPRVSFKLVGWTYELTLRSDTAAVRCYAYSSDGEWFAYALASTWVLLFGDSFVLTA